jgi:hypothetical protein
VANDPLKNLDSAIEEVRRWREYDEERARHVEAERRRFVACLDCGAELHLTSEGPLPPDLKVTFVRHHC